MDYSDHIENVVAVNSVPLNPLYQTEFKLYERIIM